MQRALRRRRRSAGGLALDEGGAHGLEVLCENGRVGVGGVRRLLGRSHRFSIEKARRVLGYSPWLAMETVVEYAQSLLGSAA